MDEQTSQSTLTKYFSYSPSSSASPGPTPSPSRRTRKRPRSSIKMTQTVIDAGQAKIGLEYCTECEMTYNVDDESDVQMHDEYHNRLTFTKPLHLRTNQLDYWKREVKFVKLTTPVEGILFVIPVDSKCNSIKKKTEDVVKTYVNQEIGFCEDVPTWKKKRTALLFVTKLEDTKKPISFIAGLALVDTVDNVVLQPDRVTLSSGSFVGINRLWIHQTMRRKRLGTLLVNVSRRLIYPEIPLDKTKAAFNEPGGDGLQFVLAYFGQQNGRYLTYDDN